MFEVNAKRRMFQGDAAPQSRPPVEDERDDPPLTKDSGFRAPERFFHNVFSPVVYKLRWLCVFACTLLAFVLLYSAYELFAAGEAADGRYVQGEVLRLCLGELERDRSKVDHGAISMPRRRHSSTSRSGRSVMIPSTPSSMSCTIVGSSLTVHGTTRMPRSRNASIPPHASSLRTRSRQ